MRLKQLAAGAVVVAGLASFALLPLNATPPPPPPPDGESYKIDNVHSSVSFSIKHAGVSWSQGRFNKVEGTVVWNEDDPSASSVEATVDVKSIDTNDEKRDQHLLNADFFHAQEFPTLTFKSKKIWKDGDGYKATGDLTLRGQTREITMDFQHVGTKKLGGQFGTRAGWWTSFNIKRTDFGMGYGVKQGMLGDTVRITISLEGIKQ